LLMIPCQVWCVKHPMAQRDWRKLLRAMRCPHRGD
jgi:hypothetical protein